MSKTQTYILAAVALLAVLAALWYVAFRRSDLLNSEVVACTEEALLCPDGSAVGRSGPECRFTPCPNQPSFTGELREEDGGYKLIVAAPDRSFGEVSYSLPIKLIVDDTVRSLVGTQVTAVGTFHEGNTLYVERLDAVVRDEESDAPPTAAETTLGVGASGFAGGVRITFDDVAADSRCPTDVQCIQAGSVSARVTLKSDTDEESITLSSGEAPHPFDSFYVSIVDVDPEAVSTEELTPDAYKLTFRVEPLGEVQP